MVSLGIVFFIMYYLMSTTSMNSETISVSTRASSKARTGEKNPKSESKLSLKTYQDQQQQQKLEPHEYGSLEIDTPFMPSMANETLKAELGNAAWRLLHTILARYPEEPNENQRQYLEMYIKSFAQVYPCGDCARHFIKLLEKYPPQTNSRKNAALWGCFIHNQVNKRLEKEQYDCTTILEDYDCGCGKDEEEDKALKLETDNHLKSIRVESSDEEIGG